MSAQLRDVQWNGVRQTCEVWEYHENQASASGKEGLRFWKYQPQSFEAAMRWVCFSRKYYSTDKDLTWPKIILIMDYLRSCTRPDALAAWCERQNMLAEQIELSAHDKQASTNRVACFA
jgi:hypothetical protein